MLMEIESTVAAVLGFIDVKLPMLKLPKPVKIKATHAKIITIPSITDFIFIEEKK